MRRVLSLAGAAAMVAALGISAAGAQPTPPARFYGTAQVDGRPAAEGTTVSALVAGKNCGTGTVSGGSYVVDVASATTLPGCGTDGGAVNFQVGGVNASQTGTFQTGAFVPLNLTAQTPAPSPTPSPSRTPTVTPTPARTPIPQDVQQRAGARFQSAAPVSGPTTLTVGQTTRVRIVYTITNPLNEPVDYSRTAELSAGSSAVRFESVSSSAGTATTDGTTIRASIPQRGPGEGANIELVAAITPNASQSGPLMIIGSVTTTGTTASGLAIRATLPGLDSLQAGLSGFVIGAQTAAPAPASTLPRTGTGTSSGSRDGLLVVIAALAATAALAPAVTIRRIRRRQR